MPLVSTGIDDLPPMRIARCDAARREPGMMLFNVRRDRQDGLQQAYGGWLMGVDQDGELVCIHKSVRPVQGVRCLPNGTVLVTIPDGLLLEMTFSGDIVRQWYASGSYRNCEPPKNAIRVEAETFHHGVNLGPDGNLLLLSMEIREYDDWPGSTTDPNAPRARARVVGDVVMEVRADGTKMNEWRMLDMLDPYRISYGSRDNFWVERGYPDTNDWCHANATAYDARDDSILVSLRTQDCIVKFDRKTGALRWILGSHDNWRQPWSDKLLKPDSSVTWQFHQHDCSMTPAGTIMCFDNGDYRAHPFEPAVLPEQNHSRAVEYAVDETAGTVAQVWSYCGAPNERLFASVQGGAFRMPKTGNAFITYGGICSIDGKPAGRPGRTDICARLIEITPEREVVFDLWVGGGPGAPKLSVFRSELCGR